MENCSSNSGCSFNKALLSRLTESLAFFQVRVAVGTPGTPGSEKFIGWPDAVLNTVAKFVPVYLVKPFTPGIALYVYTIRSFIQLNIHLSLLGHGTH